MHQDKAVHVYHKPLDQPVYVVDPVGTHTATIIWLHGLLEHAYRFLPHAISWAKQGYQVILLHLKGHGIEPHEFSDIQWLAEGYLKSHDSAGLCEYISRRADADPTYFVALAQRNYGRLCKLTMADHLKQVHMVVENLANITIEKNPLFIGGHSLGGLIAAEAAAQLAADGPVTPAGVILLNPALRPSGPGLARLPIELSWWGRCSVAAVPISAPFWGLMKCGVSFNTAWGSRWVSDIKAEQALHAADPLIGRRVPAAYLTQIQKQMAATLRRAADYPVDLILFSSRKDHIVHGRRAARFGAKVAEQRGESTQVAMFTDTYAHELLRSTKRKEVSQRLYAWLAKTS